MHCLKCWTEIQDEVAVFTKSCSHVFCKRCSEKAFKKEMSCPLCDTVLAKDGIGELKLRPDDTHIKKTATKLYGLSPENLCDVLQLGLEFWVKQKQNQSLKDFQELKKVKARLEEAESKAQKLSKALHDERLVKKSLQNEKDGLEKHVAELETRYAEKTRSMRKLNELYSELRQVHRRLESDLRGVRNRSGYEEVMEVKSKVHTGHEEKQTAEEMIQMKHLEEEQQQSQVKQVEREGERSERFSFQEGHDLQQQQSQQQPQRHYEGKSTKNGRGGSSARMEELFTMNRVHESGRPFMLNRRHSRESGKMRRRPRESNRLRSGERRALREEESVYLRRGERPGEE